MTVNTEQRTIIPVRHLVTLWLAGLAASAYLCRTSISVVQKTIREDLGLSELEIGFILGPAFFWTYALAQVPAGRWADRRGARFSLPLLSSAWSLATGLFGLLSGFPMLVANWMLMGLAQAGAIPVATKTISVWNPKSGRAFATGVFVGSMYLGAGFGAAMTGWIVEQISWRVVFGLYAIPGFLWAIGFASWFRNRPEDHPSMTVHELALIREVPPEEALIEETAVTTARSPSRLPQGEQSTPQPLDTPWWLLVTSPATWLICGQQFCRAAGLGFFASWFPTFLQEARHISVTKSGFLTVLPHLATVVACLIGGHIADQIFRRTGRLSWSRKGLAVLSLICSTALLFAPYFVSDATQAVVVFSLGVFFAGLAGPVSYTVTMDMGGKHVASVFATMNMVGNIGTGLLALLVPQLRVWISSNPDWLEFFGGNSWNAVIVLVALLHLIAAICWQQLRIQGTVFDQSFFAKTNSADDESSV